MYFFCFLSHIQISPWIRIWSPLCHAGPRSTPCWEVDRSFACKDPPEQWPFKLLFSFDSLVQDESTYFLQAEIVRPRSNNHCHKPCHSSCHVFLQFVSWRHALHDYQKNRWIPCPGLSTLSHVLTTLWPMLQHVQPQTSDTKTFLVHSARTYEDNWRHVKTYKDIQRHVRHVRHVRHESCTHKYEQWKIVRAGTWAPLLESCTAQTFCAWGRVRPESVSRPW